MEHEPGLSKTQALCVLGTLEAASVVDMVSDNELDYRASFGRRLI